MIDQGFCFNAGEWNYPDAPLRGLYTRNRVYEGVTGMDSFAPWIGRVQNIGERVLEELVGEVPRNGTTTITTRWCGCSSSCTVAGLVYRNSCWTPRGPTGGPWGSRCGWRSCGRCCSREKRGSEVRKQRRNEVTTQERKAKTFPILYFASLSTRREGAPLAAAQED
jgi:hypothetical protein